MWLPKFHFDKSNVQLMTLNMYKSKLILNTTLIFINWNINNRISSYSNQNTHQTWYLQILVLYIIIIIITIIILSIFLKVKINKNLIEILCW